MNETVVENKFKTGWTSYKFGPYLNHPITKTYKDENVQRFSLTDIRGKLLERERERDKEKERKSQREIDREK